MIEVAPGLILDVDRGPDWLLVGVERELDESWDFSRLADRIWSLLEQSFTHRLVLDLSEVEHLDSLLLGQLMKLYQRIMRHDGVMRVCGLSPANQQVLLQCKLETCFPIFDSRTAAIRGRLPNKPR